mgnify:CR=1 FL=1
MPEQEWRYVIVDEKLEGKLEKPSLKFIMVMIFMILLSTLVVHILIKMTLKQLLTAILLCCSVQYVRLVYLTVNT